MRSWPFAGTSLCTFKDAATTLAWDIPECLRHGTAARVKMESPCFHSLALFAFALMLICVIKPTKNAIRQQNDGKDMANRTPLRIAL